MRQSLCRARRVIDTWQSPSRALARGHNLVHYREITIARSRDDAISLPARSGVPTKVYRQGCSSGKRCCRPKPSQPGGQFSSTSTPSTDLASLTCHATGRRRAALSAYRACSTIQLLSTVKPSWTTWMRPDATPPLFHRHRHRPLCLQLRTRACPCCSHRSIRAASL